MFRLASTLGAFVAAGSLPAAVTAAAAAIVTADSAGDAPNASVLAAPHRAINLSPSVEAALAAALRNEPKTLSEQVRICEIPAPPFMEEERAKDLERLFVDLGLKDVRQDMEGNVIGVRPGAQPTPNVVVSAHLDTVFPDGTDVTVRQDGVIYTAPGIGDDARGLAAMLSTIEALDEGDVRTQGTITFVGTVGEEGLGDLRGVKYLFDETLKDQVDYFISIDGLEPQDVTRAAVGSYRYRVTFTATGGHSYIDFGIANPIHALGRAINTISDLEVPESPRTTFSVGRVGGGTSVNSIAFEAWMEVDLRSERLQELDQLEELFLAALQDAFEKERDRWNGAGELALNVEQVGLRPPGGTPLNSEIMRVVNASIEALGLTPNTKSQSTDSNVPMALGIPAITVGGGGSGTGFHSLQEDFNSTDSHMGPQLAVLLATGLTGLL